MNIYRLLNGKHIAVACPEWRGLKVSFAARPAGSAYIAVACPEWRGLKAGLLHRAEALLLTIAVACPEWRGLKVAWLSTGASKSRDCSGLPRMEGTERSPERCSVTNHKPDCSGLPRMEGTESFFLAALRFLRVNIAVACPEWRGLKAD